MEGCGCGLRTGDPTDWLLAWVGARGRQCPVRWERGGDGVVGGRGRLGLEFPRVFLALCNVYCLQQDRALRECEINAGRAWQQHLHGPLPASLPVTTLALERVTHREC